jgi:signal transduction histidine kinase
MRMANTLNSLRQYNTAMAASNLLQARNTRLLTLATYLTLVIMAVIGIGILPDLLTKAVAVFFCGAVGLVHAIGFQLAATPGRAHMYFAIQSVLIMGLIILDRTSDPFTLLFFILGVQAGLLLSGRAAVAWIAIFYLASSFTALWSRGADGVINVLFNAAAFFFTGVYGYTLRQAEKARQEKEQVLEELQSAQRRLQDMAIAEERNRLARDLHDSAKQQAFALSAQLDAAQSLIQRDPSAAETHLQRADQLADNLRQELANLILQLRPPEIGPDGLPAALRRYATEWSKQSNIEAVVEARDERALPPAAAEALLRVTQEALANVARHSRACHVDIQLIYTPGMILVNVVDDGKGFDPLQTKAGVGTRSMRERVSALPYGTFTLDSAPGRGTRVTAQCST